MTYTTAPLAYYVTPSRIWELALGGLLVFVKLESKLVKTVLPWCGFLLILSGTLFINESMSFPGFLALIPTIGASFVILGGGQNCKQYSFDNISRIKPIQLVGNMSYSLYLWHFPLIVLIPQIVGQTYLTALTKLSILVLSLVLAYLSYRFIEMPTKSMRLLVKPVWRTYLAGIIALILVGSTNLYVKIDSWQKVDVPLQKMHELVLSNDDCVGARAVLNSEVCGNPFEMQVPPEFAMVAGNDMYGYSFDKGSDSRLDCSLPDAITNSCTIGDLTSNNSILLAGDSHAQQLIAAFDYYGKKMNLKVIVTVTAGEGALDEKRSDFIKNEITKVDSVYVAQIFKYGIDSIQRVPTIELLEEIIGLANSIDKPVTLIQDIPWVGESCGSKHSIDNKNCKSPISEAIDNYVQENLSLDGFSDRYNYIQTSHIFCDTDFCYSTIGKLPVYHDHYAAPVNNAHITQSFSHTLGDFFAESISQIRSTKE